MAMAEKQIRNTRAYCITCGSGGRYACLEKQLFFLILPLLAALPFADSYFHDLRGGYLYNVCLRTDKKHYFAAKYLAVFLSGGTAVTLPLLANFLLCSMFLPSMKPESVNAYIRVYSSFPHLFFSHLCCMCFCIWRLFLCSAACWPVFRWSLPGM